MTYLRVTLMERRYGPDHPGVVLRRYAAAWADADLDTLLTCSGADFTLRCGGESPIDGTNAGCGAAIAAMREDADGTPPM